MKPPKITEGEWHREYYKGFSDGIYIIKDSTGKIIAKEVKALDAKLIASAPDMLKALVEAYKIMSEQYKFDSSHRGMVVVPQIKQVLEKAGVEFDFENSTQKQDKPIKNTKE